MRKVVHSVAVACVLAGCSGAGGSSAPPGTPTDGAASGVVDAVNDVSNDAPSDGGVVPADVTASDAAGDGGASRVDSAAPADAGAEEAGTMRSVYMTFYGWADNSPPGSAIAYPKSGGFPTVHDAAGGKGTYADPITFATDKLELPVGTIVYAPVIEKYLMMEDDCVECDSDWSSSMKWHIDVWMNSSASETSSALLACEDHWTQTMTTVEVSPPPDRTVTTPPLFDPSTNVCRTSP